MSALLALALATAPPGGAGHFAEAIRKYNLGDKPGALAEFQRARQLDPRPAVLFNIGIIAAGLEQPLLAAEALDALLAAPGSLPAPKLRRAAEVRARLEAQLGALLVRSIEGAALQVDGRGVGTAPLAGPLRVRAGRVLVSASAAGYAPGHLDVEVPGGATREVALQLEPLKVVPAQLRVACPVPGADVLVDGVRVAVTPVEATVALVPGTHRVSAAREGYRARVHELRLDEGALAEVSLELEEDLAHSPAARAVLAPRYSETQVQLSVDGARRGVDVDWLELPAGPHLLTFERGGFYPVQRSVWLSPGAPTAVEVLFEPTPELRASLQSRRALQRGLGLLGLGAGGLLLAGGGAAAYFITTERDRAEADYRAAREALDGSLGCATSAGRPACEGRVSDALAARNLWAGASWVGPLLLGVGAASVAAGIISLLTAPDLSRFEGSGPAFDLESAFGLAAAPSGAALVLRGRF